MKVIKMSDVFNVLTPATEIYSGLWYQDNAVVGYLNDLR